MQVLMAVGILTALLSGKTYTADQLAAKFELSRRSVYRYLDALSEANVPLVSKRGRFGGWKIDDNFYVSGNYFTKEEYDRLLFCLQSSPIADDVGQRVCDKIAGLAKGAVREAMLTGEQLIVDTELEHTIREKVNEIKQAIRQKRLMEMEYHSKEGVTVRTVEPYTLILKGYDWYVYCFCRLRQDFRYFKISRIAALTVLQKRFEGRAFAAASALDSELVKDREKVDVILTVQEHALSKVEDWIGVSNVTKIGASEDFTARATVPFDDFLVDKILSFGSGVKVETPEKLKIAVKEKCREIAARY